MKTLYSIFFTAALLISSFSFGRNISETTPNDHKNAVSIKDLKLSYDSENGMNIIRWETANFKTVNYFIVEKTVNGSDYSIIGYVFAGEVSNYHFRTTDLNSIEYRIKAISFNDEITCTTSLKVSKK